jgi:hypothetical protein
MYRAIPEASVLCAMADRARSYRLHREALAKIAARPSKGLLHQPLRERRSPGRAHLLREDRARVASENVKMKDALAHCRPTFSRVEFEQHERDHKKQVRRKQAHVKEVYGFPTEQESDEQFEKLGV